MKKSDYIKENGCANSVKGWVMILILFALLFFVFGCGCNSNGAITLNNFKKPIIVVAKDTFGIVLRDAKGEFETFDREYILGSALGSSYNVGDTIK